MHQLTDQIKPIEKIRKEAEKFWEELVKIITEVPKWRTVVLLGNFNAQ